MLTDIQISLWRGSIIDVPWLRAQRPFYFRTMVWTAGEEKETSSVYRLWGCSVSAVGATLFKSDAAVPSLERARVSQAAPTGCPPLRPGLLPPGRGLLLPSSTLPPSATLPPLPEVQGSSTPWLPARRAPYTFPVAMTQPWPEDSASLAESPCPHLPLSSTPFPLVNGGRHGARSII